MDGSSEPSICFPGPCALASSFNEDLVTEIGKTVGRICRDKDVHMILAPGLNIKRNPLCGRNFEYFSEDPIVSGKMGAAYVEGVQSAGVGACVKHFACNSQESFRMVNDSIVDKRALHEIYLKSFEIAIKEAKPYAVMASYNKINGTYASANDYLLCDVLKGRWDYDGVVMSDWGGTRDPIFDHAHGLDIEMPCFYSRRYLLKKAVRKGLLPEAKVDDSVSRIARLYKKCHAKVRYEHCYDEEAHDLSVKAAEESFVLLKNDGVLPIKSLRQTSIIGELARTPNFQGGGSSKLTPYKVDSFLSVLEEELGKDAVFFAPGYRIDGKPDEEKLSIDAVDLAARGGRVILFMGLAQYEESEGYDRKDLHLPEDQIALFNQIYEVNQNIVVVLNVGAPVELPFKDKAKAILLTYLPGEGGGRALYRLLKGEVSPSGHLAETWPRRAYDVPSFGFYPGTEMVSLYRESIYVGYRYYLSAKKTVNYPFGFGLSYTRFKYGDILLSKNKLEPHGIVNVAVPVTNIGVVPGKAVVQIYQEPPRGNVFKPLRSLLGFKKVQLDPGETKLVTFTFGYEDFSHFDIETESFAVEGGDYQIQVCEDCQTVKDSVKLQVLSDYTFPSRLDELAVYYNIPDDGFLCYDNDFESLLGRYIPMEIDRGAPPYDMHSTLGNIRYTVVGKSILKAAKGYIHEENPEAKALLERVVEEMPIRNLVMKIPPRKVQVVLDLANRKYFKAIHHLFFYKRLKKS